MPELASLILKSANPNAQKRFYLDLLGMRERKDGCIGYADEELGLLFEYVNAGYSASKNDLYWKISISVPDIELACRQLIELGVAVDGPSQFGEVGYLAHLEDPLGFQIELIGHRFAGEPIDEDPDISALGGGPHLSLLTLRCHDADLIRRAAAELEMTLLSIVPVSDYGFTLYFFGYASEHPPNPDPFAIENRTWVYQRPHTSLEIMHREASGAMQRPPAEGAGYAEAQVRGLGRQIANDRLLISAS